MSNNIADCRLRSLDQSFDNKIVNCKIAVVFAFILLHIFAGASHAAGLRTSPSITTAGYGDTFAVDIVADGIPADGLGTVQFRLNASAPNATVDGVSDPSLVNAGDISVVTPLLIGPSTISRSGIADFFWSGRSANGILAMDNDVFRNGSGLYTLSHTNGAVLPSGTGSIARFLVKAGNGVSADHVSFSLSDVTLLNGDQVYPLDYATGADVQLRCRTQTPSLLGLSYTDAVSALTTAHFTPGTVYGKDNTSGILPLNVVIEQSIPAGSTQFCGSTINVAINTPPTGGIIINNGGLYTANPTISLLLSCSDTQSGCSQMMFSNDNTSWSAPEPFAAAKTWQLSTGDGPKTVYVKFTDGFRNAATLSAGITLAMVPPVTVASPAGGVYKTSQNVILTTTGGGTIYYTTDGNLPTTASPVYAAPIVTALSSTIRYFAVSQYGAVEPVKTAVYTIDSVNPTLTISSLPDGAYTNNPILNLAGNATDNVGLQSLTINGAAVNINDDGSFSQAITLIAGQNTISTIVTDLAGNTATDTRTIILDQTAPVITITDPSDNSVTNNAVIRLEGVTDKTATIFVAVNSAPTITVAVNAASFSVPITLATNAINTIIVTAIDLAGNISSAKRTIMNDETNPELSITIPNQDMGTNQTAVAISGTVSDMTNISLFVTCPTASIGAVSAPTSMSWSVSVSNFQPGVNSITVQAVDQAGNSTNVMRNIIYTMSPVTIDPVLTPTNITSQTISGTMEQNALVTVSCPSCMVGAINYPSSTTWQVDITLASEGTNTIIAAATDGFGNTSSPASAAIVLDLTPPTTTATPGSGIYGPGLAASLSTSETATIFYTLDGSLPTTGSMVYTGPIGIPAATTLQYFAVDLAGNAEAIKTTVYTIDTTPPAGSISINNGAQYTNSLAVTLNLACTDAVSGCSQMQFSSDSITWSGLEQFTPVKTWSLSQGDGSKTVYVKYSDGVGNISGPISANITLDTAPPETAASPAGGLYNKALSITLTANEAATIYYTQNGSTPTTESAVYSGPVAIAATTLLQYFGVDAAGNSGIISSASYTIDMVPPVLTMSTLPDGAYTNNATLNIAGTVTDNIAVQGVTINGAAITVNADGAFSGVVNLGKGSNTITTIATDLAGNLTTDTRTIILDQTAPVITIAGPADNSVTGSHTITVDGTTDKPCAVLVSVNSGPTMTVVVNDTTFSLPITLATNTNNTIYVYATDLAGNTSTAKRTVTNDETNPELAITIPNQDMGTNQTSVTVSGTISDLTNVTMLVTCPTASVGVVSTHTSTTWSVNVDNLQQGMNAITVTATDRAGNSTTAIRNIISTQTPVTIDPVKAPTNVNQQTVTGAMELNSTVTVSCSTATVGAINYPTATTWQAIIAGMTEGANTITAMATDLEGNISNAALATIVLDTQPPVISIQSGPTVLTNSTTAAFTFTASESGCAFSCRIDDGAYSVCSSPMTYAALLDGPHTFQVVATDPAGNAGPIPAAFTWTVDTIPPTAVVSGVPPSPTNARNALLTVSGNDVLSYEYQLDSGALSAETPAATPISLSGLLDGTHTLVVIGKDGAGNWQQPQFGATASWIVDIVPPVLTLSTLPNNGYTNNPVLNIAGTATDTNGIQSVIVSGQTVTLVTSDSVIYAFSQVQSLATGTNTITTTAADNAGNITVDTRTIMLDQTAPVITVFTPADNSVVRDLNMTVSGATDKTATVLVSLNSGPAVTAATNATTFSLPITLATNTNNTILVYATDLAGNTGTAKRTVMNDEADPELAVMIPNQDMGTNQTNATVSGIVSDLTDVSLLVSCPTASVGVVSTPTSTTWSVAITNLQQGTNIITVTATDEAGNSTTVIRNIISNTSPVTIDPVKTLTNNNQQVLTGTMELNSLVTVSCPTAAVGMISYPTPTSWQMIIAGMTEGANTISATATDLEGNTTNPVAATIALDTHSPVTTPSPTAGTYYNSVAATLAANEPATIYYTLDGTAPTTSASVYSGPLFFTSPTTLGFFAVDLAGNTEPAKSVIYTVVPDIAPPVTTITLGTPNYTSGGGQLYVTSSSLFTLSATDAISGVKAIAYRIDDGAWNTYATPFSLATEGTHSIGYKSTDNAGNVEQEKILSAVVDNTQPVSTIAIGAPPVTVSTVITISATDSTSGVKLTEYAIDGGSWTAYSGGFTLALYSQGMHTIAYRSTDNVGNVEIAKSQVVQLWTARPTITTAALADGTVAAAYSQTLVATGATSPYLWSISSGMLPAGLQLNSASGMISGTPASAGISTVTFLAADANSMTNTKVLAITIYGQVSILTNTLVSGTTGSSYTQTLTATGGKIPYAWSIAAGALPTGLSLNASTGMISGTPSSAATSTFTVQVMDANSATTSKVMVISISTNIPQNIGVFGATGVTMTGGGYVDSYDSTQGAYNGTHGSNVSVGTNSIASGAVTLSGGAVDYGNMYVGPGGNPSKVIIMNGRSVIDGTIAALSRLENMTPMSDPGGGTQTTFTNGTTLASGTYRVSSINLSGSGKGTINGNVTLYVTGSINLSGSSQIVILPGGSLTIYLSGSLNISGGAIVNQSQNPHNLMIYGTSTCTTATYSGGSVLYGAIYAPAANTTFSGGSVVYGAVLGNSLTMSGGSAVHYDVSLGNIGD